MLRDNTIRRPGVSFFTLGTFVAIAVVALLATMFVKALPANSLADGTVPILLDAGLFFLILCVVVGTAMVRKVETRQLVYRCALTVWWILLVDETFFARVNTNYGMGAGHFSLYAYAEAAMWLVCWVVALVLTLRSPGYVMQFFKGSSKWLSFFVMLCLASIAWA